MEARLPNFWEQNFASGSPAAYLPYQKSLPPGRKAVCISEAGYRADGFCCQHSKMTKLTKNETSVLALEKPRRAGGFAPTAPVTDMWDVLKNLQVGAAKFRRRQPETRRI